MKEQDLLPNEKIITSSGNIVLTSHRIRHSNANYSVTSILLRNVSSIKIQYSESSLLLVVSILFFGGAIYGIAISELLIIAISVGFAVLFLFLFYNSRTHNIAISSKGGKSVFVLTKGLKSDKVTDFINKVEKAIIEENIK